MSEIISPILLDQTGQDILEQLQLIAANKASIAGTSVTVSPNLNEGTLIAAIKIDNTVYGIYIPKIETELSTTSNNLITNSTIATKISEIDDQITALNTINTDLNALLDKINRVEV